MLAAYTATGLSLLSILVCLITFPLISLKIAAIQEGLSEDQEEFRVRSRTLGLGGKGRRDVDALKELEAEVWSKFASLRTAVPRVRKARQAQYPGYCQYHTSSPRSREPSKEQRWPGATRRTCARPVPRGRPGTPVRTGSRGGRA